LRRQANGLLKSCAAGTEEPTREEELAPDLPASLFLLSRICRSAIILRLASPWLAIRLNPETKHRSLDTLQWGSGFPTGARMVIRVLSTPEQKRIDIAPAFRRPFPKAQMLDFLPTAFTNGRKRPREKIPYSLEMKDGSPFCFRGPLGWPGRTLAPKSGLRTLRRSSPASRTSWSPRYTSACLSFCRQETHEQWLSGESGKEILRPFPANEMTARPISKRINKPEK